MEITVTGRHIEVTAAIREYAHNKVSKLPKYFDRISAIEVVADKQEPARYHVEIIVDAERHKDFVAHEVSDDLYACIDRATDKIERQLTDHKERLRNRKHPPQ
jgi:putative sigma-54 modulation protein